jgi:anti-sigma factor RsiW
MSEQESADDRLLGALVRNAATRHLPQDGLRARIVSAIGAHPPAQRRPGHPARRSSGWTLAIAAAAFGCGVLASWLTTTLVDHGGSQRAIDDEVVSAHVRAVMMARATDIASSDQHTVKPWLSSKLDFSPTVGDLAGEGYPLAGGRLDYVGGRPVAALVYQRNRHWIDVFVWPVGNPAPVVPPPRSHNGFNTAAWDDAGLRYWAVSDIAADELATFTRLLRARAARN